MRERGLRNLGTREQTKLFGFWDWEDGLLVGVFDGGGGGGRVGGGR